MAIIHNNKGKHDRLELLLYAGIWLCVFLFPLIGVVQNLLGDKDPNWVTLRHDYLTIIPFFVLFYINVTILIPYVLLKGSTKSYTLQVIVLLTIFVLFQWYTLPDYRPSPNRQTELLESLPPPPDERPGFGIEKPSFPDIEHPARPLPQVSHPHKHNPIPGPVIVDLVIAILLLCAGIGIKVIFNHFRQQQRIAELEKEQMQEKLDYLKAQLSPHFLMNILNNIHGMVEINPAKAQRLILEMSSLMRYVLYKSSAPEVPLKNELDFVRNYISLMKSRYSSKKVEIELIMPNDYVTEGIVLPPLLFIVFIENAFKHGISYRNGTFIKIEFDVYEGRLIFRCTNSLRSDNGNNKNHSGGLGLKNVRKRLTMLFGEDYTLLTEQKENKFTVTLNIPIYVFKNF